MSEQSPPSSRPQNTATPWHDLDEAGTGLTVDAFITTMMSQVGNALRRTITLPYADQFGLSVSEWRLLSLVAHAQRVAFSDLVLQSTSDKALVSRTLKLLEGRGLVALEAEGNTPRKKIYCVITDSGRELHAQAIPIARARQAAAIRVLPVEERDAMYRALLKLRAYCSEMEAEGRHGNGRVDPLGLDI
ncbi:MarR family winged helix-turn-helix transcriptional regulator [Variovorax sp. OV329]|uniref:MarR family winged helix-turn-helix transcriptional regulator n=1 Tax=Variovorax sp. OV329 TaxID=1882825 RepID=UPI0008EF3EA0|nr:MarR family winged helix-turn-helix transcriptional regulator [Variovorax sp. OV329]SFN33179.1 DNA-binding transcriptional regulator, MarR family [Variovorax sp. OV329]